MRSFLILISTLVTIESANILGISTYSSYSHHKFLHKIYKELSIRGHKVTIITTHAFNDRSLTNLTEIEISNTFKDRIERKPGTGICEIMEKMQELQYAITLKMIDSENVKNLLQDGTKKFHLVLNTFSNPFNFGFGHRFNAPVIDISHFGFFHFVNARYGNPNHPILYPDAPANINPKTANYWDKLKAVYYFLWSKYHYYYFELPRFDKLAKKFFGDDLPYLGDLELNGSMYFTNTHPLLNYQRPNVPTVVELLPLDNNTPKALPSDLKKILDEAKAGVIYVSFGTTIASKNIDKEIFDKVKKTVSELPYTFLWKWEFDSMPGKPSNVIIKKSFPQIDLLAHRNVKLFITQGGLHSIEESISGEVPMIGIPFLGDQVANVQRVVDLGIAEQVDFKTFTESELKSLILKVAETESYKVRVKEIRKFLYDTPMTGLEKAVWWSEYVIRHKGARHLRTETTGIHWYQHLNLDVLLVVIPVSIISLCVMYVLVKVLIRICNYDVKFGFLK